MFKKLLVSAVVMLGIVLMPSAFASYFPDSNMMEIEKTGLGEKNTFRNPSSIPHTASTCAGQTSTSNPKIHLNNNNVSADGVYQAKIKDKASKGNSSQVAK